MKEKILLKNVTAYNSDYTKKTICNILIEDGLIKGIEKCKESSFDAGTKVIDVNGKLVLPSFIDSHLHIPGDILYNEYGVNLMNCQGINEYIEALKNIDHKKYKVIRGFRME